MESNLKASQRVIRHLEILCFTRISYVRSVGREFRFVDSGSTSGSKQDKIHIYGICWQYYDR